MTPGALPLTLYRGDTYRWRFVFWTDEAKTVPADLTGVNPRAELRVAPGGAIIGEFVLLLEPPNVLAMSLDPNTAQLLPPTAAWDLQLTYPSGDVATVLAGAVTVTADVTDSGTAPARVTAATDLGRRAAARRA